MSSDPKGNTVRLSDEQQSAVDAQNRDILVSAAAGSGKTSVLVERIFRLIAPEGGVDADRLLVVTFTRAAAAQMKERIRRRIDLALSADPDNARLRRQEALLHHAQITTIDAFCSHVIKENFASLDIDPQARIADDGERKLLEKETLEETLERLYDAGEEDFLFCCDYFSAGTSDARVSEYMEALHRTAQGMPDPVRWLTDIMDAAEETEAFETRGYVRYCIADTCRLLESCVAQLSYALKLCAEPDGPSAYADRIEADLELVKAAAKAGRNGDFDALRSAVLSVTFDRLSSVRKTDPVSPILQTAVKTLRDDVKETVAGLKDRYFRRGSADAAKQEAVTTRAIRALASATIAYEEDLRAAKREKNLMDFSDIGHLALQVLAEPVTDEAGRVFYQPTGTAEEYRQRFAEVMIDEYQDSSMLQEVILSAVADRRFMVGDVKQSIYRFRQACPELFTRKLNRYEKKADAKEHRIDLHRNFRSRPQVLDTVNAVFRRLMGEHPGGVVYDADAELVPGDAEKARRGDGYGTASDPYATEVMLCEAPEERDETEAYAVAKRILSLTREPGTDGRQFRFGDIVILMRATSGREDVYRSVLEDAGIPVYVESRTGYYDVYEIRTVLQLLAVLNNPLQDIPFVSLMRSVIGGFDDTELARIRAWDIRTGARGGFFAEITERFALQDDADAGDRDEEDTALASKVRGFLKKLESFREKAVYLPVHTLLETVLDETGFASVCAAMPGGARRSANLEVLLSRAKAFEQTSYRGLSRFVSYIETLRKFEADEGEANVLGEHADVVRIMTIHKSKGLEFPVVFVTGLSTTFNLKDAQRDLLIDTTLGVACADIDIEKRTKASTLKKNAVASVLTAEALGEEMRVLYVAMTRAIDKLILSGTVKDPEKDLSKIASCGEPADGLLSYAARTGARSYLKWLLYALWAHPAFHALLSENGIDAPANAHAAASAPVTFTLLRGEDLLAEELTAKTDTEVRRKKLESDEYRNPALEDILLSRFSFVYPHEAYQNLFTKTTVTELKEALLEEAETGEAHTALQRTRRLFSYTSDRADTVPSFLRGDASEGTRPLTGAAYGLLTHKAMELVWRRAVACGGDTASFAGDTERIRTFLEAEDAAGRLDARGADEVLFSRIAAFMKTPLAARMRQAAAAKKLFPEKPFMLGVSARELDCALPENEILLIQGIIDCYFEEPDGLTVLDYKTDRVRDEEELVTRYKAQLDYYARALTRITERNVKERLIYSFALERVIVL